MDEDTQVDCNDQLTDGDEWRNVREQAFWKETSDPNWRELYQRLEAWHGYEDPDCDLVKVKAECSDFEFLREQGQECEITAKYCRDGSFFMCRREDAEGDAHGCAGDFYERDFWAVMREEQFWEDNMD